MDKQEAYSIVLDDILNSGCELMLGKYDAKNGDSKFMHGVCTVMEWIAYRVDEETGKQFSDIFLQNMIESQSE